MSSVSTFFRHCPYCGRRFEIRLVEKKKVDSADIVEEEKIQSQTDPFLGTTPAPLPIVLQENVPKIVDVKEFRYTYRCKHCGHQWSEFQKKDETVDSPEGYTGD
jgi:DNA-directed RNA polymerase subunit RPC12/RpoP